ncbi:hypothetical protein TWF281_007869 [Arthrobotrys megalospora]
MEAVGAASSVIAIVELSAKVASVCLEYYTAVKDARDEITRLQIKAQELGEVARGVQELLDGDQGRELLTSQKLENAVRSCRTQMEFVEERLHPSGGRKIMRKFGLRALKWPFESKEVDKIISELEKCGANISSALQVDQTRIILEIRKLSDLEKISSAPNSEFDDYTGERNTDELNTRCHPNTRTDLLHQVRKWANDPQGKCIFWLKGMAGTGKSTISRTVAKSFNNDGLLGASFFFKRGEGERGNATRFFTTIAGQLLRRIPDLALGVRAAIQEQPKIAEKSINEQFERLIFQPLSQLKQATISPLVLVIDALDECEGERSVREIIHLLSKMRELTTAHIRIFLTSRPELSTRLGFGNISPDAHEDLVLQDIPRATVEHDISAFLKDGFAKIRSEYNQAHSPEFSLSPDWPGDESIQALTKTTVPLFIFAATICRFVEDRWKWNPKERLATVLKYGTTGQTSQLDQTYLPVLKQLEVGRSESEIEELGREFRKIIGSIVVLADSLCVGSIASLLGISREDLYGSLHHLHSVLSVPSDLNSPVRLLHLSFREFLVDPKKESRNFWFWTDEKKTHSIIATRCLEVLSTSLKENICSLGFPGMLRKDIDIKIIDTRLPAHIRYSCYYWVHHLEQSRKRISDEDEVHTFLRNHFLHWIEALSLIGKVSDCIGLIDTLRSLADENKGFELSHFLYDARRFLLQNRWIINEAPLQLYSSAIIFSPEASIVKTMFRNRVPTWICRLPKTSEFWSAELQKLEGHAGTVTAIAFSPDGKRLVSGSRDELRFWNTATGEQLQKLKACDNQISAAAFSPDGQRLASGSHDGLRLWDAVTGELLQKLEYSDYVKTVAFSPDSKRLASGSGSDDGIRLWDAATGEQLQKLEGHSGRVEVVVFSPDGQRLASGWGEGPGEGPDDGIIGLWDATTGEQLQKLEGHSGRVYAVAFSPDGQRLASGSGSDNGTIRFWDVATGEQLQKLEYSGWIYAVAFSPDSQRLASGSGSDDGRIRFWDVATGEQLQNLEGHSGQVEAIAFSPDGKQLASSHNRTIRLWDTTAEEQVQKLEGHSSSVHTVALSPDSKQLASGSKDRTIRLWDAATGEQLQKLESSDSVSEVVFSPDGQRLASRSDNNEIGLWDIMTGKQVRELEGHSGSVSVIAFSPDGKQLASGSTDETIRLWNAVTGEQLQTLTGQGDQVHVIAFSSDSKQLASGSGGGTIVLWDAATGEQLQKLEPGGGVNAIAFSPDGQQLALGTLGVLGLWDAATGERLWELGDSNWISVTGEQLILEGYGQGTWVRTVAFSPDGQRLASGLYDGAIRLWDVATGEQLQRLEPRAFIDILHFSSDGERLETNRGVLAITPSSSSLRQPPKQPPDHILLSGEWITRDGQNLLWLPYDYRGFHSASRGNNLIIGQESGAVTFFEFAW